MNPKAEFIRRVSYSLIMTWEKRLFGEWPKNHSICAQWMDERSGMKSGQWNRKISTYKMISALLTYPCNGSSVYLSPKHVLRTNCVLGIRFTTINLCVMDSHLVRNQTSEEYNPLNQMCKSNQCACGMHGLQSTKQLYLCLLYFVSLTVLLICSVGMVLSIFLGASWGRTPYFLVDS